MDGAGPRQPGRHERRPVPAVPSRDAERPAQRLVLRPPAGRPPPPEHPGNTFIDTWLARSNDGGATWRETRVSHDSWDPTINPPISGSGEFIGDYQGLVADDCYATPFVNDTHLTNAPGRDPDFDAGLPRSPFQEVFAWLVPNTPAYGGRAGDCREGGRDGAAPSGPARATRRASRAGTRVLRATPRRALRAIARRNAIVGPK